VEAGLRCDFDRTAIARGEQCGLAAATAVPHRADRVDHVAGRQAEAGRDPGVAGRAAAERTAGREQLGAGRAVDRAVDAAAAEQ
jgi:hypothetical protein